MKYNEQEQLDQILHRGEKLRIRKDKNLLREFSATASILVIALTVCIHRLAGIGVLE